MSTIRPVRMINAAVLSLALLAAGSLQVLAAPPVGAVTITETNTDPGYKLRHDWGPALVREKDVANSCLTRDSEVENREHWCRVIDGYEDIGDDRNWIVDLAINERPMSSAGSDTSKYGRVIVLDGGSVFEGCNWRSPTNDYVCDYRMRKPWVLRTSGDENKYVLRKLWKWTRYIGDTAGCAAGITGLWSGQKVTLLLLADCDDGPMDS